MPAPEHLAEKKLRPIRNGPARVFREAEDLRVLFGSTSSTGTRPASPSPVPAFSRSGSGSLAEPLPDDAFRASRGESEALERDRPGPLTRAEYPEFVWQFHGTAEKLKAIPTAEGLPRFTLDD